MAAFKYLDLRYKDFEGPLLVELFDKDLDAIFLNNNRFDSAIPDDIGNSPASVLILAKNRFVGCIPKSIGETAVNLKEILFFWGMTCPAAYRRRSGSSLISLEELDLADNVLTRVVPAEICASPKLANLNFSFNYLKGEALECSAAARPDMVFDDNGN
ncbi:hypothetical protein HPP92_021065 [Vanilla planifolia]|uniref:Uncharacterized protein n=1 Tax=Vanilla planifolia TaxID=51239 RepID=A0A835PZ61_VANPL|nr:hypothetical protein HPP92_021368 [Vanilla planifolia]KAG0462589.1 hypothetical protein HPP92_021065 [Vanilla planifolia]